VTGIYTPWPAWLHLDGWAGPTKQPIIVIGESPKRYRIMADVEAVALGLGDVQPHDTSVRLAGRRRTLRARETVLVPKRAITKREGVAAGKEA